MLREVSSPDALVSLLRRFALVGMIPESAFTPMALVARRKSSLQLASGAPRLNIRVFNCRVARGRDGGLEFVESAPVFREHHKSRQDGYDSLRIYSTYGNIR